MTDSEGEKGAQSKAVRAVGAEGKGPQHLQGRGAWQRHSHPKARLSGRPNRPPRSALQGGSLFCPRNTDLEPTRPVPPGDAAGRRGCPAPGRSVPGQPGLRPHARSSGGAEAWRVGGRGGPAGQPGGLVHRFEEDRAFSSCGVKTNRATNAPAPLSNQEARPPWKTLFTNGHQQWAAAGC